MVLPSSHDSSPRTLLSQCHSFPLKSAKRSEWLKRFARRRQCEPCNVLTGTEGPFFVKRNLLDHKQLDGLLAAVAQLLQGFLDLALQRTGTRDHNETCIVVELVHVLAAATILPRWGPDSSALKTPWGLQPSKYSNPLRRKGFRVGVDRLPLMSGKRTFETAASTSGLPASYEKRTTSVTPTVLSQSRPIPSGRSWRSSTEPRPESATSATETRSLCR